MLYDLTIENKMTKLTLIIEKGTDGMLWGRLEVPESDFLPVTVGKNAKDLIANIVQLIQDHQLEDGEDVTFFKDIDASKAEFELKYDIQALFQEFSFLNITDIANRSDINAGLLRQYASGVKHASEKQAKKIEVTLHDLAHKMLEVSLV